MSREAPDVQTTARGGGGFAAFAVMALIYCCFTPGIVGLLFAVTDPNGRMNEYISIAYLIGAPLGLLTALLHWLMRNASAAISAPVVILFVGITGAIGGPIAIILALAAACLTFPLAQWLQNMVRAPNVADALPARRE